MGDGEGEETAARGGESSVSSSSPSPVMPAPVMPAPEPAAGFMPTPTPTPMPAAAAAAAEVGEPEASWFLWLCIHTLSTWRFTPISSQKRSSAPSSLRWMRHPCFSANSRIRSFCSGVNLVRNRFRPKLPPLPLPPPTPGPATPPMPMPPGRPTTPKSSARGGVSEPARASQGPAAALGTAWYGSARCGAGRNACSAAWWWWWWWKSGCCGGGGATAADGGGGAGSAGRKNTGGGAHDTAPGPGPARRWKLRWQPQAAHLSESGDDGMYSPQPSKACPPMAAAWLRMHSLYLPPPPPSAPPPAS
ncbi:hypothetical protein U9M48_032606 [Paspalum notatum var. saurae]|uniref:Uncharacterized protein n=1 Tax=Paspalum notatum var. saurae TaxID=547442 RepID=A0AAQ3U932_PASNO